MIRSIKVTKKSDGKTYEFNIGALSVGIVNETISELEKFLQEKVSMGDTVAVYGRRYNENPDGATISVQNIECSIEVCNYVYGKRIKILPAGTLIYSIRIEDGVLALFLLD